MTQILALKAELRERAGKGNARATRRSGNVPAVIYGDKQTPVMIAIAENVLTREIHRKGFFTHLYEIEVEGKKHRVLPRDIQFNPVTDRPEHVDFLRVGGNTTLRVEIPLTFVNQDKSPGLKRGGVLNTVVHTLALQCQAHSIPEAIEVDLSNMEIGDSIQLGSLTLPKGAKAQEDSDFTVATIAAPTAQRAEAEAAPAAAAAPAAGKAAAPAAAGKAAPAADAKKAPAKK